MATLAWCQRSVTALSLVRGTRWPIRARSTVPRDLATAYFEPNIYIYTELRITVNDFRVPRGPTEESHLDEGLDLVVLWLLSSAFLSYFC